MITSRLGKRLNNGYVILFYRLLSFDNPPLDQMLTLHAIKGPESVLSASSSTVTSLSVTPFVARPVLSLLESPSL